MKEFVKNLILVSMLPIIIVFLAVGFLCGAVMIGFRAGYAAIDLWSTKEEKTK